MKVLSRSCQCCAGAPPRPRQRSRRQRGRPASVVDDPIARQILDEYYALPDTLDGSVADLFDRFADKGLEIVIDDDGVLRPATDADLGIEGR